MCSITAANPVQELNERLLRTQSSYLVLDNGNSEASVSVCKSDSISLTSLFNHIYIPGCDFSRGSGIQHLVACSSMT